MDLSLNHFCRKVNKETKGLSAFDMDDTLALTKEKVKYTMPDGTTGELTAGEFAVEAENLTEKGAEFDFSNFENVDLSTPKGPLAGEALKKQAKYGSKDIYVVTARPGAAQQSIKTFLDSIGLNIPLENIITLEDGSPQAKADWVISKAEEGYNDFSKIQFRNAELIAKENEYASLQQYINENIDAAVPIKSNKNNIHRESQRWKLISDAYSQTHS